MTQAGGPRFGLRLPTFVLGEKTDGLETIVGYVQRAEQLGFESAFTIDHLVITPPAYACTWLESIVLLTAIAARTQKIKVGPLVLVLPLRNPVYLAKTAATLDFLSGGRFILGVGVGWNEEEFHLLQVPFRERGKRTGESIEILKKLWTNDRASHQGQFFQFENLSVDPKPVQKPHPPIWIGGGSQPFELIYGQQAPNLKPVFRRVARWADVWVPHSSGTPEMVKSDWEQICAFAREYGRDARKEIGIAYSNFVHVLRKGESPQSAVPLFSRFSGMNLEYWQKYYLLGTVEEIVHNIRQRVNAVGGMDHIILNPLSFDREQLELLASEILPRLRT
ncbi:MAG: TIGR03619 family F420-dependent LLM class oxidoreductase [Acidobacteria bacterium]|nr:TIGR03619 family F420-dependent LLM class oxidoreductase [Acidobacteriota bacterium]